MAEKKFIEDNIDRMLYYRLPTTTCSFEGFWCLSAFFSSWRKKRLAKREQKKEMKKKEKVILVPDKSSETITI